MTEKRFNIVSSEIVEGGKFIQDNNKKYSFPTTKDSASLVMYEKTLNKLSDENEQLKESLKNKMESDAYWEQKAKERVNKLEKENEELKKDLEILVHLVDWRDKLEKEWWRCEHFTNPLGVAFCRKNEDFCKRGECGDI